MDNENELTTPKERAKVLNIIIDALTDNNIDLQVGGYKDDGVFFSVLLIR